MDQQIRTNDNRPVIAKKREVVSQYPAFKYKYILRMN